MISDLVLLKELPEAIRNSVEAYVGCLSGASMKKEYLDCIKQAGFSDIKVVSQSVYPIEAMANDVTAQVVKNNPDIRQKDLEGIEDSVLSIKVGAIKPRMNKGTRA